MTPSQGKKCLITEEDLKAEERLDQVFLAAGFSVNHPIINDWIRIKFILQAVKRKQEKASENQNL